MKALLDTCVWSGAVDVLTNAGHEVEWVGAWDHDPGDVALLQYALTNHMVLVTIDKDFGELAVVRGLPHHGVIRLVQISARQQGIFAAKAISKYGDQLDQGAIVTVEPGRIRVRGARPSSRDHDS